MLVKERHGKWALLLWVWCNKPIFLASGFSQYPLSVTRGQFHFFPVAQSQQNIKNCYLEVRTTTPENRGVYRLRKVVMFKYLHICILLILLLSVCIQFRVVPQVVVDFCSLLPGPFLSGTKCKHKKWSVPCSFSW